MSITSVTYECFNTGKSMSFRRGCIFLSLEHQLKSIFKQCTTWAYIFVQQDTDVKLISNDTVVESNLCDCNRALVTISCFCFRLRFHFCATFFLNKVVSEQQSINTLVSMKVCPFDSSKGIIGKKVWFAPGCVFIAASIFWSSSRCLVA